MRIKWVCGGLSLLLFLALSCSSESDVANSGDGDGDAGQVPLLQAVHHPDVNAQEACVAYADGGEHADAFRADDPSFQEFRRR